MVANYLPGSVRDQGLEDLAIYFNLVMSQAQLTVTASIKPGSHSGNSDRVTLAIQKYFTDSANSAVDLVGTCVALEAHRQAERSGLL